jgi:hypothetical protein
VSAARRELRGAIAGGKAPNVPFDEAKLKGVCPGPGEELLDGLFQRLLKDKER